MNITKEEALQLIRLNLRIEYSDEEITKMLNNATIKSTPKFEDTADTILTVRYDNGVYDYYKVLFEPVLQHLPYFKPKGKEISKVNTYKINGVGYLFIAVPKDATDFQCCFLGEDLGNLSEFSWSDPTNYCVHEDAPLLSGKWSILGLIDELTKEQYNELYDTKWWVESPLIHTKWMVLKGNE